MKNIHRIGNGISQENKHFLYQQARPDQWDSPEEATQSASVQNTESLETAEKKNVVHAEAVDMEQELLRDDQNYKEYLAYKEKFTNNPKGYIRDGNEVKKILPQNFSRVRDIFPNDETGKVVFIKQLQKVFGGAKLSPQELSDLFSIVHNGVREGKETWDQNGTEYLQILYNKLSTADVDLNAILESNSSGPEGVDNMYGIATIKAGEVLQGMLTALNMVKPITDAQLQAKIKNPQLKEMEIPEIEKQKPASTIEVQANVFENKMNVEQFHLEERVKNTKEFFKRVDLGNFQTDRLGEYFKNLETSDLDKIMVNGIERDFDYLDDLQAGQDYTITGSDFIATFTYVERTEGGKDRTITDLKITNKDGFSLSVDKLRDNKNDHELSVENATFDFYGDQIQIGEMLAYDHTDRTGVSAENINVKLGNVSLGTDKLSLFYKNNDGKFDLGEVAKDVLHGKEDIGTLANNFGGEVGNISFDIDGKIQGLLHTGPDGFLQFRGPNGRLQRITKLEKNVFQINNELGNTGELNLEESTFSTFIDGKERNLSDTFKDLTQNTEILVGAKEIKMRASLHGILNLKWDANLDFTQEELDQIGEKTDVLAQSLSDEYKTLQDDMKGKSATECVSMVKDFVASAGERAGNIASEIGENIDTTDWGIEFDLKALSDAFVGKGGEYTMYDFVLEAVANDIPSLSIDKNFVDTWKQIDSGALDMKKEDLVFQQLGLGESADAFMQDFEDRFVAEFGRGALVENLDTYMDVVGGMRVGQGVSANVSPDKFSMAFKICEFAKGKGMIAGVVSHTDGTNEGVVSAATLKSGPQMGLRMETEAANSLGAVVLRTIVDKPDLNVTGYAGLSMTHTKLKNLQMGAYDAQEGRGYDLISADRGIDYLEEFGMNLDGTKKDLNRLKKGVWLPSVQAGVSVEKQWNRFSVNAGIGVSTLLKISDEVPDSGIMVSGQLEGRYALRNGMSVGAKIDMAPNTGQGIVKDAKISFIAPVNVVTDGVKNLFKRNN